MLKDAWVICYYRYFAKKKILFSIPFTRLYSSSILMERYLNHEGYLEYGSLEYALSETLSHLNIKTNILYRFEADGHMDHSHCILDLMESMQDGRLLKLTTEDYSDQEIELLKSLPIKHTKLLESIPLFGPILIEFILIKKLMSLKYQFTVKNTRGKLKKINTQSFNEVILYAMKYSASFKIPPTSRYQYNKNHLYMIAGAVKLSRLDE